MEKSYSLNSAYYMARKFVPVRVTAEIQTGIGIHVVGIVDGAVKILLLNAVTAMQQLGYSVPGKKVIVTIEKNGIGASLWTNTIPRNPQLEALEIAVALCILIADGQLPRPETEPIMEVDGADATFRLAKAISKIKEGLL